MEEGGGIGWKGSGGGFSVSLSACTWLKRDLRDGGGGADCDGGSGGGTDLERDTAAQRGERVGGLGLGSVRVP